MSCCGKHRTRRVGGGRTARRPAHKPAAPPRIGESTLYFQYVGRTALTATGPGSGRRYRFGHPGAVLPVDPRDRRAFASVPRLRQVRQP
jgi:hypothetical protein